MNDPWWSKIIPDIRAWATFGMFVMVFYMLHLLATHPELADNELFKTVATLLVGSGAFGLCCSFIWGGSKTTAGAIETVNHMARRASDAPAAGGTVTVSPPANVTVVTEDGK